MDEQQLLRQPALLHDLRELGADLIDDARVDRPDDLARDLALADVPLGVQRQRDVRLAQPLRQPPRLGEEAGAAGLDVEDEQRVDAAGGRR